MDYEDWLELVDKPKQIERDKIRQHNIEVARDLFKEVRTNGRI